MKKLNVLLCVVLVLAIVAAVWVGVSRRTPAANITIVDTPDQSEPIVPEWARPAEAIVVDFGDNIALNAMLTTSGFTQVYNSTNANDGDFNTYWEGKAFPSDITAELDAEHPVGHVVMRLNPAALWGARTQNIEVQGSTDGENFETLVAAADYIFDPETANTVVIEVPNLPTLGFVRVIIASNTGAAGGQIAELEVYQE